MSDATPPWDTAPRRPSPSKRYTNAGHPDALETCLEALNQSSKAVRISMLGILAVVFLAICFAYHVAPEAVKGAAKTIDSVKP